MKFPLPEHDLSGGRVIITSPFGPRGGGPHNGTDIGTTDGIEFGVAIYANEAGAVIRQGRDPGVGAGINLWLLTNRVVSDRRGRTCRVGYKNFHLSDVLVANGPVAEGQLIAAVGNTGTGAAHLHQQMHLVPIVSGDPINWDWSDATAVSHTALLQDLLNAGAFVGATPTKPTPEEDIMATRDEVKADVQDIVNAAVSKIIAAIPKPEDDKWMATHGGEQAVYIVIDGIKFHVPGEKQPMLPVLVDLGFDNRGIQDAALDALPSAPWSDVRL